MYMLFTNIYIYILLFTFTFYHLIMNNVIIKLKQLLLFFKNSFTFETHKYFRNYFFI